MKNSDIKIIKSVSREVRKEKIRTEGDGWKLPSTKIFQDKKKKLNSSRKHRHHQDD